MELTQERDEPILYPDDLIYKLKQFKKSIYHRSALYHLQAQQERIAELEFDLKHEKLTGKNPIFSKRAAYEKRIAKLENKYIWQPVDHSLSESGIAPFNGEPILILHMRVGHFGVYLWGDGVENAMGWKSVEHEGWGISKEEELMWMPIPNFMKVI